MIPAGGNRGPEGCVPQRWLLTPSTGPFHQGLRLWNAAGTRLGSNKTVHSAAPRKKEKKDKFLHQALTGTDKKNYRNQCRCYCFLSQLFHYLAARPWNISSFHEPLSDAPPCRSAFWSTFWRLGPKQCGTLQVGCSP